MKWDIILLLVIRPCHLPMIDELASNEQRSIYRFIRQRAVIVFFGLGNVSSMKSG